MSGFFLLGTILSLGALWYVGRFGAYEIQLTLVMLPSVLTGFVLSKWTAVYVDRGYVRPAVLSVGAGAGLSLSSGSSFSPKAGAGPATS
ncbi:MAG: hypothetical protein Ct9H300mP25_17800 [Acidobacteriota bacterium]|nr:MAG: hypothetical protein Ct9H300mP25_17800 [Acidobacteriota bacterium]